MLEKSKILNILKKEILILDGATGTELQKKGMPSGVCPEQWCIENPEVIAAVHKSYADAGADIVYSCTFGANKFKLKQYDIDDVYGVNKRLAEIAREAVGKGTLVAGDIGPSGHFVKPFGEIDFEEAVEVYKEQAKGLLDGGVDLFVIETQMDIQETRAALLAVKELCDAFVMVTMTYEADGRTLNGTDPKSALITLQSLGADAIGCNCSAGPEGMLKFIAAMKPYATVPLLAKPNAGMPKLVNGETVFDMDAQTFASFGEEFATIGINIMGGCCGTTPLHIKELANCIKKEKPVPANRSSIAAVSSARSTVLLDSNQAFTVIGERINPTGKKQLQSELREGKFTTVRLFAKEQELAGAKLLDVNVGMSGIDEAEKLKEVVELLSTASNLPLVIDTSDVEAMEQALRVYPGRALINSIAGEKDKLEKLIPLAAKYGAMFIALPLTDEGIPKTSQERADVVKKIYSQASKHGFTKDDIVVDALAMTVSSDANAALETLQTIRWCSEEFGVATTLGLSNVSFGLPQRTWANAGFLAMAIANGLTTAISNPCNEEFMNIKFACDVLNARDNDALNYIARFVDAGKESNQTKKDDNLSVEQRVYRAVVDGVREEVVAYINEALDSGVDPAVLVQDVMIAAITEVGQLFEKKEYFLPQLIASAETMKKGFAYLEPQLKQDPSQKKKALIMIATVEGDIHDIGKNIVALMFKNYGFDVIDLGKDVSARVIVDAAKAHNPSIVCLSALMTTTMVRMPEVIDLARSEDLDIPFMVGGAVVTEDFARTIGAHYSCDGVDAVKVAKGLANA